MTRPIHHRDLNRSSGLPPDSHYFSCFTPLTPCHPDTNSVFYPHSHTGIPFPPIPHPLFHAPGDLALMRSDWIHQGGGHRASTDFPTRYVVPPAKH